MQQDFETGTLTLVADHNWRKGPMFPAACAWLFGKRQRYEHLGLKCVVAWWKDTPYLIGLREAK